MLVSQLLIREEAPKASEFTDLRRLVGWQSPQLGILQQSMDTSLYWVSAYLDHELIGTGRVIGDGAMYFYIQDVIVHPEHQNIGLGTQIMQLINQFVVDKCPTGSTVGLLAAQGKEQFYEKFGFIGRDGQQLGLGMCRFI